MWKLQALLYSFLIPKEFSFSIGPLDVSAYRVLLILLSPWVIHGLLVQRKFKWQHFDTIALLICVWPFIALSFSSTFTTAIESGGVLFLETFIPFFTTRLIVYKYEHLKKLSKTVLVVSATMAAMAIPEAITGKLFVHNIASALTNSAFIYTPESRFGIWRSYGPTDHPIVLGSVCAIALPLGFALWRRHSTYLGMTAFSFVGVIASASSGPILSIIAQALLYIWSVLTHGNRYKWWLLIGGIILGYVMIDVLSNRNPFKVMFTYLLFNEHNGYVRYNMWLNSFFLATQSLESFVIGYGFSTEMMSLLDNQFWTRLMSHSVDSYWMVILLRYGMPMLLLNVIMLILVLRANLRNYRQIKLAKQKTLIQAWLIVAISFSLVACTVHFWGFTASLFFIVLGASGMQTKRSRKTVPSQTNLVDKQEAAPAPVNTSRRPKGIPIR